MKFQLIDQAKKDFPVHRLCRVIGWAVGDRLHRDLALAALRKALVMRRPPEGLIHHSDRGLLCGLPGRAAPPRHPYLHVRKGKLLR